MPPSVTGSGMQKVKPQQLTLLPSNCDFSRADQSNTVRRLASELPLKPYCSSNLAQNGLSIREKYAALEHSSIQINTPWCVKYIVLDVDRPLDQIPTWAIKPTLFVLNPENAHYHVYIELETAVLIGDKANPHPQRWLKSIIKRLITLFDADPNYAGLVAKNPLHKQWQVSPRKGRWVRYSLDRLNKLLTDVPEAVKTTVLDNPQGRNCTVFDTLRVWAYRQVHGFTSPDVWNSHVLSQCLSINSNLPDPLSDNEAFQIAKSVSKWVWLHRDKITGSYVQRDVMGFGITRHHTKEVPYLDPEVVRLHRQQAAERTNQMQRLETEQRIIDAIGQLTAQGQRVSMRKVAAIAGISQPTISECYPHLFHGK